ncbi:MAG TPA: hypothetical protein VFE62_15975, partial [Gemmataceae bacterium]|nr:hypothetical protein [Gemmataceae bacterium]
YGSAKDSAPTKVAPVLTSDNVAKTPDKSSATKAEPTKLLTLYEAVGLFEKTGKGEVVSAERLGNGEKSTFNLDVLGANGKQRFNINATGKVIVEVPLIAKKGPSGKKGMSRERIEREGR